MSERLERWKAREKLRSDIGWVAVFVGLGGAAMIGGYLWQLVAQGNAQNGHQLPFFALPAGCALLVCAVGLWNARSWARWVTAALCAVLLVSDVLRMVEEGAISGGLPFVLFAVVYLLLPSTGRRFARAAGASSPTVRRG